jgi:chloride channel protein, CIC family
MNGMERILAWLDELRRKESQLALVLSLVIGALVGLVVVAFMLLTGRLAARLYPVDGLEWRRIVVPVLGSLITGPLYASSRARSLRGAGGAGGV